MWINALLTENNEHYLMFAFLTLRLVRRTRVRRYPKLNIYLQCVQFQTTHVSKYTTGVSGANNGTNTNINDAVLVNAHTSIIYRIFETYLLFTLGTFQSPASQLLMPKKHQVSKIQSFSLSVYIYNVPVWSHLYLSVDVVLRCSFYL